MTAQSPEEISLWPADAPYHGDDAGTRLMLSVYRPDGAPRGAVVVCSGGGYHHRAEHEGPAVAARLARHGFLVAVVPYRVAPQRFPAPYADATRAVRLVRHHARQWGCDPHRIALMGFSAGGHLASTVATQPQLHMDAHDDLAHTISACPDRLILGYPVISFTQYVHEGSVQNLLAERANLETRRMLSSEQHVTASTPPTFIFHTSDDQSVPAENALLFASALAGAGVSCELHMFQHGRHGVGMAEDDPSLRIWFDLLLAWLDVWVTKA